MTSNGDEPFPEFPRDATPDQAREFGRLLRRKHAEYAETLKAMEADADAAIEHATRNGTTTEDAEAINRMKEEIAAAKVAFASMSERREMGEERAREVGLDLDD